MGSAADQGLMNGSPAELASGRTDPAWAAGRTGRWLAGAAIVVRIVAAALLIFGPWTDEPAELGDWDIERFVTIAGEEGRPWRDHPVEYPPGSVVVFEALTAAQGADGDDPADTIVGAHRLLVGLALLADLALALLLRRRGRPAAIGYLLLGLPLVPMGLLRLDIIVTLLATGAALIALGPRKPPEAPASGVATRWLPAPTSRANTAFAATQAAAAILVKVWPGLLVPALWGLRRDRAAAATIGVTALAVAGWLLWADAGIEPVRQILDLRGAKGWHVESWGGVITALADAAGLRDLDPGDPGSAVTFELNAFRIGTLSPTLVTAGRIVAVLAAGALAWRARTLTTPAEIAGPGLDARFGTVMLGSVAALLATAPLLSPQFMLWLTPWAALMLLPRTRGVPTPVVVTGIAILTTGVTLAVFGPPRMAEPVPAVALAVRNGLLLLLPISCWRWLGSTARDAAG